ncbi:hypothetical protein POM88_007839 [Heracleum sosnowskyi]|uniref:Uncharacterized protein n=1 Tax=Heracleum sosnowskyi TaxID=360622 RepID=A0AAD8J8A3_9APIA|nr:hypothetical protein POM88_007839 [Heracleum sosnowskyi]
MLMAQSPTKLSVRLLDSILQDYAFRALDHRPRTGIVLDANVPSNLKGVEVSGLRLRSGSLRKRGFSYYKEFEIPVGVIEQPFVERLALVYHNLATNLPELDIRASGKPILVKFPSLRERNDGVSVSPMCVYFDLYGSVEFGNVLRGGNVCEATAQGHFSIVIEFTAPSPAPSVEICDDNAGSRSKRNKLIIIIGSVIGWVFVVILLAIWLRKCRRRDRIQKLEEAAQSGESLSTTTVGSMKVCVANVTRTRPKLETDYVAYSHY